MFKPSYFNIIISKWLLVVFFILAADGIGVNAALGSDIRIQIDQNRTLSRVGEPVMFLIQVWKNGKRLTDKFRLMWDL